jgi:hypothetical protein
MTPPSPPLADQLREAAFINRNDDVHEHSDPPEITWGELNALSDLLRAAATRLETLTQEKADLYALAMQKLEELEKPAQLEVIDHFRAMALRIVEDRDIQKHAVRKLKERAEHAEAALARCTQDRDAARAEVDGLRAQSR